MTSVISPASTRMSFTKRVCPLLERETPTTLLHYAPAPWMLLQCLESGFVFLENPPGYDALRDDFAWEATFQRESQARKAAEPVRYSLSRLVKQFRGRVLKRNKIAALVRPLVNISSRRNNLLDIGCGWGGLLGDVISSLSPDQQRRCVPHGIEVSTELARISNETMARSGGACVHDNALRGLTHFSRDYFDLVVMSSFLEHEIQPLPLLRSCRERLRSGGHVVIKVPNYGCINRTVRGSKWCGFRWPDHVNFFTPATLRRMAQLAGFEVARMNFLDRHPLSDNMYAVLRKA